MFVGATFAWFTDNTASSGNVIQTGTLEVGMYWADGGKAVPTEANGWTDASTGSIFNNTKWEPGHTEAKHIKIANEGTLAFKYKLVITPDGEVSDLADVIDVYLIDGATQVDRASLVGVTPVGTLREMIENSAGANAGYVLAEDETTPELEGEKTLTIVLKMRESAGNEYKGKSIGSNFAIQLYATQYAYEEDDFDNTYDEEADYDGEISNGKSLAAAFANGGTYKVLNDFTMDQYATVAEGKEVTLNLNGKTIKTPSGNVLRNQGALTVANGTLEGTTTYTINNEKGSVTVNNVKSVNGGFYNGGTMVVTDCEISNTASGKHGLVNGNNATSLTVNGGTYSTTSGNAIIYAYGGSIEINDGYFEQIASSYMIDGSNVTINGGTFIDDDGKWAIRGTNMVLAGGTFNFDPTAFMAANHTAIDNGDGTWTVKVTAANLATMFNSAMENDGVIELPAGEYQMPDGSESFSVRGKTLTVKGTAATVIDVSDINENDQFVTGATLTFEGVTLNFGTANYMGFANTTNLTYKNCMINGLQFLYGQNVTFENCELNSNGAEHCVWTYGVANVTFTECDFTYGDRAVNCYGSGVNTTATFTDCTFTKVEGKATSGAIETNSSTLLALNLNINNCTVNEGDLWWISQWDNLNGEKTVAFVDGKVASSGALLKTIKNGETSVELLAGEYQMPDGGDVNLQGKTLTVKGTKDTVIDVSNVDERDQFVTGTTLTFEGVTLNFGTALYMGFANTKSLLYKDCVINGVQHLYGQSITFEGCTLNVEGDHYMVRTWGGKNVTFNDCTFNCDGKAILVYNQSCNLTVNNCVFNDNGDGTISGKAAIEACNGDGGANCVTHNIVINNTKVTGFDINPNGTNTGTALWANKNSLDTAHLIVTVDGVKVYGA